jgi:Domain of unknown function (DUF6268)
MTPKKFLPCLGACLLVSTVSQAQETESIEIENVMAPQFDFMRVGIAQTGDMELDGNGGDLSVSRFELRSLLSAPIPLWEGMSMIPMFSYAATSLNFSGTGPFPIHDEDLHSASLQSFFIQDFANSPWSGFAWTRAEMATDFQGIQSEDFTFDVAAGAFYRFSDSFTLGFGVSVTNLNGDTQVFPGINFSWVPCEDVRIGIYGPNLLATYNISESWYLSLDGQPGGGNWNIRDDAGKSRTIELDSYWIGLSTHHRLTGELWLSAGVGYTFGNEIEIRGNRGGGPSFSNEMDGAPLAQIGLSLRKW